MAHLELSDQDAELVESILRAWHKQVNETHKDHDGLPISLERAYDIYRVADELHWADDDEIGECWERVLHTWGSEGVLEAMDDSTVEEWVIDNHEDTIDLLNRLDADVIKQYYRDYLK